MKFILSTILFFCICHFGFSQDLLLLKTSGKVVIGDTSQISTPGPYNLYVQNGVMTEKVKVAVKSASDWSDDSFDKTPLLSEVQESISNKSHLVNIPSADDLVRDGYDLQKMDAKMMEQIEWLWQYTLILSRENEALKEELLDIKNDLKKSK